MKAVVAAMMDGMSAASQNTEMLEDALMHMCFDTTDALEMLLSLHCNGLYLSPCCRLSYL